MDTDSAPGTSEALGHRLQPDASTHLQALEARDAGGEKRGACDGFGLPRVHRALNVDASYVIFTISTVETSKNELLELTPMLDFAVCRMIARH